MYKKNFRISKALFEIFRQIRVLQVTKNSYNKFMYLRAFNFLENFLTFLSSSKIKKKTIVYPWPILKP